MMQARVDKTNFVFDEGGEREGGERERIPFLSLKKEERKSKKSLAKKGKTQGNILTGY